MKIISPQNLKGLPSRHPILLECYSCVKPFERPKNKVLAALKGSSKTKLKFCSNACQFKAKITSINFKCPVCNANFLRVPSQIHKNNFCSQSCSATYYNKINPKRQQEGSCVICHTQISAQHLYCNQHKKDYKLNLNLTILEVRKSKGFKTNRYQKIRDHARRVAKNNKLIKKCKICEYSKHVDACHIKSISSFPETSTIGEVNNVSNLIGLCKNHHWEFDHDLMDEKDINKISSPGRN